MDQPTHLQNKLNLIKPPQCNSYFGDSDDDVLVVAEKIKYAFSKLDLEYLYGVIQFWAPVNLQGRRMLSTCNQPFVLNDPIDPLCIPMYQRYRSLCELYRYNLDDQQVMNDDDDDDDGHQKTINGPPATVFLNYLSELFLDMTSLKGSSPLVDAALGCRFTSYFLLPVFYPQNSSTSPSCAGVIEGCLDDVYVFTILHQLKHALESVGMSTVSVQQWSYKSIPCLKHATCEIKEALEIICESHDLVAAQVWIPCENLNHVPYKSSFEGTEANKQMFTVKFVGYCADSDDDLLLSAIKDYCDTWDMLPLKIGQGLVGRTLQTYIPHFCTNIYDPHANKDMWNQRLLREMLRKKELRSQFATVECSCLGICLRSIDTGDLDYAFEFLWPRKRNYLILLESLFITLKGCLPSFKFASGSELGDELLVLDVENSTGSGTGFFNILEGNRLSSIPKALEEARRQVAEDCILSSEGRCKTNSIPLPREEDFKQQHGRSMNKPLWNQTGCTRPNFVKRKFSDMYESQGESNDEDNRANQNILHIKSRVISNDDSRGLIHDEMNYVQQLRSYEIICDLEHATNEIDVALEIVCESHYLTLAQVWVSYANEKHVVFSSDITPTKQMFALKLIGYSVDSDDAHLFSSLMDYQDTCETLPLKIRHGLAGRTLHIHQPLFYRNVSELIDSGPLPLLPANSKCSCLTICLRSTHTRDLYYAFEFFWPQRRHYLIMLESLLQTLKQCLPSFTYSFGAKLGEKLCVFDFENSTGSTFTCFHIFHGNKLSGSPKTLLGKKRPAAKECTSPLELKCKTTAIPLSLSSVNQNLGSTLLDDATNLNERPRQNVLNSITINGDSVSRDSAKKLKVAPKVAIYLVKLAKDETCQCRTRVFLREDECTLKRIQHEMVAKYDLREDANYELMYLDTNKKWVTMIKDKHMERAVIEMGNVLEVGFQDNA